ncbi:MAG TPA: glycosyltransferase [Solirubrobacteraceae bacterium]|jgi:GT2 family glycosyltransferase|nr:glycosyltransferase [Solirubrobacteraceae bacterium]
MAAGSEARVSVIVCTRDRPSDLDACLQALARVPGIHDVVVIDSASEPPCEDVVQRHMGSVEQLSYVRVSQGGLSIARNAGVAATSGEILAFIDDDALADPGWASEIRAALTPPRAGGVGGRCRPLFGGSRPRWLSDRLLCWAGITHFGDRPRQARSTADYPYGANMAFTRAALEAAGPFDPRRGAGGSGDVAGEDTDICARVRTAGYEVWLWPSAIVDHKVHPSRLHRRYYLHRTWWNGAGRARNDATAALTLRILTATPVYLALIAVRRDWYYAFRTVECLSYVTHVVKFTAQRMLPGR